MPREGTGQLPALLLDQGRLPRQLPAAAQERTHHAEETAGLLGKGRLNSPPEGGGASYGGPATALRKGPGSRAGHQRLLHPRERLRSGQPRSVCNQRAYEWARGRGMVVLLAALGLGDRLGSTRPGCLRLRWGWALGEGLGGTQDQGDDGQGRRIVRKRTLTQKNHSASGRQAAFGRVSIGRVASGAGALGALAVGAGAFGALAIGALAIRALAIKRGRIERLNIGELEVGTLHVRELVVEQEQSPRQDASVSTS